MLCGIVILCRVHMHHSTLMPSQRAEIQDFWFTYFTRKVWQNSKVKIIQAGWLGHVLCISFRQHPACFSPGFQSFVCRSFYSLRNINKRSCVSLVWRIGKPVYCRVVESTRSLTPISCVLPATCSQLLLNIIRRVSSWKQGGLWRFYMGLLSQDCTMNICFMA